MASLKDIKSRIASVKNIRKITRAMEMVAAARLRRAEQRIEALRPYADAHPADDRGAPPRPPRTSRTCRSSRSARTSRRVGHPARHRRPRPGRRVQLADHPRRQPARARAARRRARRSLWYAVGPPRRVVARVPRPRAGGRLHRLHRPPRVRRRARDRRRPDRRLRRRQGRPRRDLLQRLHLAADPGGAPRDAAAAAAGGRARRRRGRGRSEDGDGTTARPRRARSGSTSPTPRRSSPRLVPDYVEISIYRALLESTASEHGARMTRHAQRFGQRRRADRRPHARGQPPAPGGDHPGDHGSRRRAPRAFDELKETDHLEAGTQKRQQESSATNGDGHVGRVEEVQGVVIEVASSRPSTCPRSTTRSRSRCSRTRRRRQTARSCCEVQQHLGDDRVRAVAMDATDGLARGTEVRDTGGPITVPVGEATLGRIFNLLGEPIDEGGDVEDEERWPIHRPAPDVEDLTPTREIFETGIKVIDLLAPYAQGRQGRPVRRRRRRQDGAHPGADPQHRRGARRPVGVLRRGRALARGQRPLARDEGVGRHRQDRCSCSAR